MEEWTELRDDNRGNNTRNFWFNFDLGFPIEKYCSDPCKEKLKSLFDELLVSFMKEKSISNCVRPIPAFCGDGRLVDLFKLFLVVRKFGGHEAVSENNLWGFVSEQCGFGARVISTIRLIHEKYLSELDQWLWQVAGRRNLEQENDGVFQKLDLLSRELESRFDVHQDGNGDFSRDIGGNKSTNEGISERMICELNQACVDIDGYMNDFSVSAKMVVKRAVAKRVVKNAIEKVVGNGIGRSCNGDDGKKDVWESAKKVVTKITGKSCDLSEKIIDDDIVPARSGDGNVMNSLKRKRQSWSFQEVLNWLLYVAKYPDDPLVGTLPEFSKWNEYGNEEVWVQAMLAREALLKRRHVDTNAVDNLLKDKHKHKKARMHPSMYQDDFPNRDSMEKLRRGKRAPSSAKSQSSSRRNSNAALSKITIHQEKDKVNIPKAPGNLVPLDVDNVPKKSKSPNCLDMPSESQISVGPFQAESTVHQEADKVNRPKSREKLVPKDVDNAPKNSESPNILDMPSESKILVGPSFQAQIPEWTGVILKSDSKWLGTRMPSPKDGEKVSIGKGRWNSCDCPFPNSVECVRFHVAEERLKLIRELGSLFYHWGFNRMGEEVSLSWTGEEEKRFREMMRLYAAFPNKFWNNASKFLPLKTWEDLVSYYFNVFLIRRRSYQNRVTPMDVDSDDDEKGCGSIGGYFGSKALYVPCESSVPCTLNKESDELV